MPIKLKNNVVGYLATAISASDTGLVLQSGNGASFPTLGTADYFYATLVSTGGTQEVVKVTARVGDTMTVVRAQENTSAAGFAAGARVELRVTVGNIEGGIYTPEASNAVATTIQSKLRETVSIADFGGDLQVAIASAVANNLVIGVFQNTTVRIPTDAATLQTAIDRLVPNGSKVTITLNIESGHSLTSGVSISGRDCSQFRITSTDSEVPLAVGFAANVINGVDGAKLPRLSCLINANNQVANNGIRLQNNCSMVIDAGCGVKNAWGNGLLALYACNVSATGAVFSGCARVGTTGSGITSWASVVSADSADCSNSGYYGAQAAHGGILAFRNGNADNAYRHGIRATDAAIVDADGATANGCSADLSGNCVRAFEAGQVSFVGGTANNALATALGAYGAGSVINAYGVSATNAASSVAVADRNGVINLSTATVSSTAQKYINVSGGLIVADDYRNYGFYTPVLTYGTNISAATAAICNFIRSGNIIIVSGIIQAIAMTTAAGQNTVLNMSLPVDATIGSFTDLGGTGVFYSSASRGTAIAVYGDTISNTAVFNWAAPTTSTSQAFSFTFMYRE